MISDKEFNKLFAKRLRYYLDKYDMTQKELAQRLHVGETSVYNWTHAIKTPRMDKVDAMCELFHCSRSSLITEPSEEEEKYYIDKETQEIAQEIFENRDLRILFDASRNASPDDLKLVTEMVLALKKKGSDSDDTGC